jgi:hypothetical protein
MWAVFLKPEPAEAWSVVSFNLDTFKTFKTAATRSWMPPICFHDYFLLVDASSQYEIRKYDMTVLGTGSLGADRLLAWVTSTDMNGRAAAVNCGCNENRGLFCEVLLLNIESDRLVVTKTIPVKTILGYPVAFGSKLYLLSKDGVETIDLTK